MDLDIVPFFTNSTVVDHMLNADKNLERKLDGKDQLNVHVGGKRHRANEENQSIEDFFIMIVKEYDTANLFPTFKTLVDQRFYLQLSTHTDVDTFEDVAVVVKTFKFLVAEAEKALYNLNISALYNIMSNEMFELLFDSRHLIFQFNLKCNK